MQLATAHHHKRKRREKGLAVNRSPIARFIDVAIYPIGAASILMALPQAYEVWAHQNVEGVSLATWGLWAVFSLFWITYGYVHKNRLIFYMNIGWFVIHTVISVGVIVHT